MKIINKVFIGQDAKMKEQKTKTKHIEVVNVCTSKPISIT